MFVAPVPVILLIILFELGKLAVFAMVLFCIDTIRLIFLAVPCMVVVVLFVVIGASGPLILGSQRCRGHRNGGHQGGTQQSYVPETGHGYSPLRPLSNRRTNHLRTADGDRMVLSQVKTSPSRDRKSQAGSGIRSAATISGFFGGDARTSPTGYGRLSGISVEEQFTEFST